VDVQLKEENLLKRAIFTFGPVIKVFYKTTIFSLAKKLLSQAGLTVSSLTFYMKNLLVASINAYYLPFFNVDNDVLLTTTLYV